MRSLLRASILFFAFFPAAGGLLGQSIRVLLVSGPATIQDPDDPAPRAVEKGELVPIGSRIVTGAGARVVLTPFPGIKSILAENSSVLVERAVESATADRAKLQQATLDLRTGVLVSDLEKESGVVYDYAVRTPRGLAGARGTLYTVAVDPSGVESILVSDGSIQINLADGAALLLSPGRAALIRPGEAPVAVSRLSELPAADQALLQSVMDLTLDLLADVIEAGVDLQGDALRGTLDFAREFGFALDPLRLDSIRAALELETAAETGALLDRIDHARRGDTDGRDAAEIVSERREEARTDSPSDPRTPEQRFADGLDAARRAAFLARPADIRAALVTLHDADYTVIALDPDPISGLTHTDTELRDALSTLVQLKTSAPVSYAYLKEVAGGASLPAADTAPSPTDHSPDAFRRTADGWFALSPAQRARIVELGAGGALIDTSATYLDALLASLSDLPATDYAALRDTGWGAYLVNMAGEEDMRAALALVSNLDAAQRAVIRDFNLSPYALYYYYEGAYPTAGIVATSETPSLPGEITRRLTVLAGLSASDRATLRRLDLQDRLLSSLPGYDDASAGGYTVPTFSERLGLTLTFFNGLETSQQDLVVALGAGAWLFEFAADQRITTDGGARSALDLVRDILRQVSDLPEADREAARTLRLFDATSLTDNRVLSGAFTESLAAYLAAPEKVQRFIRDEFYGYALLDVTLGAPDDEGYNVRPFSEIVDILSQLSLGELETLRDMEIGTTLADPYFFPTNDAEDAETNGAAASTAVAAPTPAGQLRSMIGFFAGLSDTQKSTLRELGILGATPYNFATFLADFEGLDSLLRAYAALPGDLRAETQRIQQWHYGQQFEGRSFFLPLAENYGSSLYYVSFTSDADLHIGATRHLRITSGTYAGSDTFDTGPDGAVHLRAADLVELEDVRFSTDVRSLTASAATLNLMNVRFNEGMVASLNSKDGEAHFGSSKTGAVNFIHGNSYGGVTFDGSNFLSVTRGNLAIGSLAHPAALPTYTAPADGSGGTAPLYGGGVSPARPEIGTSINVQVE